MSIRVRSRFVLPALSAFLLAVAGVAPAEATILTFEGGISDLAGYGDNIDQAVVDGFTYPEGAGFTPDITVDFVPSFSSFTIYPSGYASLVDALGHQSFNVPSEIILTPSQGAQVFLLGFDIATWAGVTYTTDIRIWDNNGSQSAPNLFSSTQELVGDTVYQPLTNEIAADGPLHLYISNIGSTGLDNLHFAQVPEPGTGVLVTAGLLGLAVRRQRGAKVL
jgi:hypothetical protein